MAESTADKTHDPTPHRRQQAREAGHVARSYELSAAAAVIGGIGGLYFFGVPLVEYLKRLMTRQLGGEPWLSADVPFAMHTFSGLITALASVMLPILALIVAAGVAGNLLQSGLLFLPAKIVPDFSRIDPLQGLQRVFALRSFTRLGFGLFKLALVGTVGWFSLTADGPRILACGQLPPPELARFLTATLFTAAFKVGLALVVVAVLDYAYERWRYERELRMTPQEIREEVRNQQGDPQLRTRRRNLLRTAGGEKSSSTRSLGALPPVSSATAAELSPRHHQT